MVIRIVIHMLLHAYAAGADPASKAEICAKK